MQFNHITTDLLNQLDLSKQTKPEPNRRLNQLNLLNLIYKPKPQKQVNQKLQNRVKIGQKFATLGKISHILW